jgi:hypothetical protein
MYKKRYTISHRIDDIISLIQILAFADKASRTETGLTADLGKPRSAKTWEEIAQTHSEFFRYSKSSQYFTLIARYTTPKIIEGDPPQRIHAPISNELVKELLNIAVLLYDKEVRRREYWIILAPPIIASIPGLIAIFLTLNRPSSSNEYLNYKIDSLEKKIIEIQINSLNNLSSDSALYYEKKGRKQ